MAIKGVHKVSGEITKEQHQGMKANHHEKKAHKKTQVQKEDSGEYTEDLHKNI